MKTIIKSILAVAALSSIVPAKAEIIDTGKRLDAPLNFILKRFSIDKEPRLIACDWDEYYYPMKQVKIYDDNFNEVSFFIIPDYQKVTCDYTYYHAVTVPSGVKVRSTENYPMGDVAKEDFINRYIGQSDYRVETHEDEVWALSNNENNYFYYKYFGYDYPEALQVWRSGSVFYRRIFYDYDGWTSSGEYGEPITYTSEYSPEIAYIELRDAEGHDCENFNFTQTLFNTDANFEWLVEILEIVDVSYYDEYNKVEGKEVKCTGYRVESQDGSVVTEFKSPVGLYFRDDPQLYVMGDKNYLVIRSSDVSGAHFYYVVYEINPEDASVKMVGEPHRVSVDPTTPRRGTLVNVDLGNPATEGCKIVVTSASGRDVMTKAVEPGSMGTTIDTARFEKGMYIVTVTDGKTIRENTKIIIR